jgi:hypothetical protein
LRAPVSESGLYFSKSRVATPTPLGQDSALARLLWERSEKWVSAQGASN